MATFPQPLSHSHKICDWSKTLHHFVVTTEDAPGWCQAKNRSIEDAPGATIRPQSRHILDYSKIKRGSKKGVTGGALNPRVTRTPSPWI